jgi:hypothetical protein
MENMAIYPLARFGKWTALEPDNAATRKRPKWKCRCDCGTERSVNVQNMMLGLSTGCGCTKRTHGHTLKGKPSPTMRSYLSMVERCTNPKASGYAWYGGRGITVCERWLHGEGGRGGFECFLEDMHDRPSLRHTLDRNDNERGYEQTNCSWATLAEQARNRSNTTLYEYQGERLILREIAERTGLSYDLLRWRLTHAGMTVNEAVSTRVQRGQRFSRDVSLKTYLYRGRDMTIRQIAEASGVGLTTLKYRLKQGYNLELATQKSRINA